MAHMLPDGSPPPPKNVRETIKLGGENDILSGSKSIALNHFEMHEVMAFDKVKSPVQNLILNKGTDNEASYARTAHSQGEMFGLSKCFRACGMLVMV